MSAETTIVEVALEGAGYRVTGSVRDHELVLDEPTSLGGTDAGPTPVETLLTALGACTAMTLQMYATRKGWPLRKVEVTLRHEELRRSDCLDCPPDGLPKVDRIERHIAVTGELDPQMVERLLDIANRCPVHRILTHQPVVVSEISAVNS